MTERREDARRRVCLGGLIEAAAYLPPLTCTVRDVSLTGARIRVPAETILPERIVLRVPLRGECRLGRIVWRAGDLVGLRFEAEAEAGGDDRGRRRIEAAEAEIARLQAALLARAGGGVH